MYEELIKRLRHNAINADSGNEIGEAFYQDVMQAADAIEVLSKMETITNADRIRAMTDEELAKLPMKYNIDCPCCPMYKTCGVEAGLCSEQWLTYLKQEKTDA